MRVVVGSGALLVVRREAAASSDGRETGGILLGYESADEILVTAAGDAGPHAIRAADFFVRDLDHAQRLADNAWEQSGSVWVGDWHTHPGGFPCPSRTDLTTYSKLLADPELGFMQFLSIILAPRNGLWDVPRMRAWVVTPTGASEAGVI